MRRTPRPPSTAVAATSPPRTRCAPTRPAATSTTRTAACGTPPDVWCVRSQRARARQHRRLRVLRVLCHRRVPRDRHVLRVPSRCFSFSQCSACSPCSTRSPRSPWCSMYSP